MGIGFKSSSELFDHFQMIHVDNSYELISFFENYEEDFSFMCIEEQFIILCYYANALYATNQFEKYLLYAKIVLQKSIVEDIQYVDNVDVYLHTLKQMVRSHIVLEDYDNAIILARQLLGLVPHQKAYKLLLFQALMHQRPLWVRQGFALGLWGLVTWTGIELAKMMYWGTIETPYSTVLMLMQSLALLLTAISLVTAWQGHRKYVAVQVENVIRTAKRKNKL